MFKKLNPVTLGNPESLSFLSTQTATGQCTVEIPPSSAEKITVPSANVAIWVSSLQCHLCIKETVLSPNTALEKTSCNFSSIQSMSFGVLLWKDAWIHKILGSQELFWEFPMPLIQQTLMSQFMKRLGYQEKWLGKSGFSVAFNQLCDPSHLLNCGMVITEAKLVS